MKEGWKLVKLEDVCKFSSGFAFKSNKFAEEGEPIIRISDIQNDKVDDTGVVFFDPKDYDQDLSKFIIYPNDILIAMSGGTTGKIGINKTGRKFYLNQRVGVFREDKAVLDHTFLFHYLHTKSEEGLRIAAGAAQPNLSSAQIKNYIIPLPPLPEQQRIVEYLDSTFAEIDTLKAKAAEEVANAKAMFDAALREEMTPKEGWEEKTLGEIAMFRRGSFPQPYGNPEWYDGNESMPFVQVADIQEESFNLVDKTKKRISKLAQPSSVFVESGTVLVSLQGSIGKVSITQYDAYVDRTVAIFHTYKTTIDNVFFAFQLKLRFAIEREKARGTTIKTITKEEFTNFSINVPSLIEQHRIVTRLDTLRSLLTELEQKYAKIAAECDALKQAILRETFE